MYRFLFLMVLILFFSACHRSEVRVEKGISKQLADWRKANIVDPEYDLHFVIPSEIQDSVFGQETLSFSLKRSDTDVQFDFKGREDDIIDVVCNGVVIPVYFKREHLIIKAKHLIHGKNRVEIHFHVPDQSLNRNDDFLYTLFVPDRASTAFPCFDQPNLKAVFHLTLQIPKQWTAVANSPKLSVIRNDSIQKFIFAPTKLLPTYLFSFVAGKFHTVTREWKDHDFTLYHRIDDPKLLNANLDSIFNQVFRSIDFVEKYTGIPYPFPKYDFVAIPSFQYGGMEHPGAILYRSSLLFPEGKPSRQEELERANLLAHETSHTWFGDLVTMPWFNDVWLKEVFANFIADKITEPLFPDVNSHLLFLLAHQTAAYSVDRTAGTHSVRQPLANLKDAGTLYGNIIYHKAPILMDMLERKLGKEPLRQGISRYLKNAEYGNADWDDLVNELDQDGTVKKWSKKWIYSAGRSIIQCHQKKGDLVITQVDELNEGKTWPQTISVCWEVNDSIYKKSVSLTEGTQKFPNFFKEKKVDWIYPNADGKTYGFIKLDSVSMNYLYSHINDFNDDITRAAIWTDLNENMLECQLDPVTFVKTVLEMLPSENNRYIYERVLAFLNHAYWYCLSADERNRVAEDVEDFLHHELENHAVSSKTLVNTAIDLYTSSSSLKELKENWRAGIWDHRYSLSIPQQNRLAYTLALKLPEVADSVLSEQESRLNNPDQLKKFKFIRPALSSNQEVRDSVFYSWEKAKNREHEPWVLQAMYWLNHPLIAERSVKYIEPALDLLPEIQCTGDIFFPNGWVSSLLEGHHSKKAYQIIKHFVATHQNLSDPLMQRVLQHSDYLFKKFN